MPTANPSRNRISRFVKNVFPRVKKLAITKGRRELPIRIQAMTISCNKRPALRQPPIGRIVAQVQSALFSEILTHTAFNTRKILGNTRTKLATAVPVIRASNAISMRCEPTRLKVPSSRHQYFAFKTQFRLYLRKSVCYIQHPAMRTLCNEGAPSFHFFGSKFSRAPLAFLN